MVFHALRARRAGDSAPLRGEASYNTFYALKKALVARGYEVQSRANLNLPAMALGPKDTLVLGADERTLSSEQVRTLLAWVEKGGALVFSLPAAGEGRGGDLVASLGIDIVDDYRCLIVQRDGVSAADAGKKDGQNGDDGKKANTLCFSRAFGLDDSDADDFDLLVGDDKQGYSMGRSAFGDGTWFAAADLGFLHNRELGEDGNADLAWQVLGPMLHGGRVHLVYASDVPPLHVLLVRYGWPVLLPALFALLAWLWLRSRRFGPLLPAFGTTRRALREHVDAAGEFQFRSRRASALYAPVRRAFDERLRRDDPATAALDGEALVAAVAARTGRSPAVVRRALLPTDINHPDAFLDAIKLLSEWGLR
jgi:hypothetical protein